jgi:hypothetical protein
LRPFAQQAASQIESLRFLNIARARYDI